jgi:hypothetical protein
VNLDDFNVLASRFGQSVAPAAAAPARGSTFGGTTKIRSADTENETDELLA